MVEAVLADPEKDGYSDIIQALEACQFIQKGQQKIAAVRLPLEGEYRDFWELPYDETLRTKLFSPSFRRAPYWAWFVIWNVGTHAAR